MSQNENSSSPTKPTYRTTNKTHGVLRREYMSISANNPFDAHDSASRKQMYASHQGQALVLMEPDERYIQTGTEREYGKATFDIRAPCRMRVVKIVDLYPPHPGRGSIPFNPLKLVVYEDMDTKEIGCLEITNFCQNHQYFGFKYKPTAAMAELRQDAEFEKDTVFMQSPSLKDSGAYRTGVELNVSYLTMPFVSEDGIGVCEDVLPRMRFRTLKKRVVQFGHRFWPVNLYGDENVYKPFPDIGDRVRDDGLLMALREYDVMLGAVEMDKQRAREPDLIFDKLCYSEPSKEFLDVTNYTSGVVVDIRVHHEVERNSGPTPPEMEEQALKYDSARRRFYQEIHELDRRLARDPRGASVLRPEFHSFCKEAITIVGRNTMPENKDKIIKKLHRQAPLDEWYIEFTIEYIHTPKEGYKLTGCQGNKGVIVKIMKPEEMPLEIRDDGLPPKRADIVMDPFSSVNRIIPGVMYEQYINAAHQDAAARVRKAAGFAPGDVMTQRIITEQLRNIQRSNPDLLQAMINEIEMYYQIVSPVRTYPGIKAFSMDDKIDLLAYVIKAGAIHTYLPPENEVKPLEITRNLVKMMPPHYGKVTYIGNSKRRVVTKSKHLIGSSYFLVLEKIPDDFSAVSSGKVQHFGILSQITASDKYSHPTRCQPVRQWDESTTRNGVSYVGPVVMADIADRNNNPLTHRAMLRNIHDAASPTNIDVIVNRDAIPLGDHKAIQMVNHVQECAGFVFEYAPCDDK